MGIIEEAAFGDFRFVPEEEEVLPLKAYALASALILFSYSESIGVLTEETVGCVAVSFFCAMVNGLAREVFALFSYRRIQYKSYRKSFSTKSKYSFANGEEKLRKVSRDSLFFFNHSMSNNRSLGDSSECFLESVSGIKTTTKR